MRLNELLEVTSYGAGGHGHALHDCSDHQSARPGLSNNCWAAYRAIALSAVRYYKNYGCLQ